MSVPLTDVLEIVMFVYFAGGLCAGSLAFCREPLLLERPWEIAVVVGLAVFHALGCWRASRTGKFLVFSRLGWWTAPLIGFLIGFIGVFLTL